MIRSYQLGFALALIAGTAACNKDKALALEEYTKIDTACKAGEKDKAKEVAVKAYAANAAFKTAFDEVFKDVGEDKSKANVCGLPGTELKMRLSN
jgi:hypothetical protein